MKYKILIIFILAFIIRLIALNQSLWADEGTTARVVSQYSYQQIITQFSPHDFHPSTYYLFMKGWTQIFGISEISLRMPSVIFSLLTGYLLYLIAGIWAAAFFLFNPLIIYYSQEARMYIMATFFLTAALFYFLKIIKNTKETKIKKSDSIFFGAFISLSLLTFYGSIFLIAPLYLYFLYKKQYKNLIIGLFVGFINLILISPLLITQLTNSKIALSSVAHWSLVLGKANIKNLLLIPVKFAIGRIDFYPKWLYYSISGAWTLFILFQITIVSKIKDTKLYYFLFICPLVLGFLISFWTPLLQYFRFIYLIPILAILLSYSRKNRWLMVTGFTIFSLVYLLLPQFYREDWKGLAVHLDSRAPVYMILPSADTLKYYRKDLVIYDLQNISDKAIEKNIVVIPYTTAIYGLDYKTMLKNKNYKLTEVISYRNLTVEYWQR